MCVSVFLYLYMHACMCIKYMCVCRNVCSSPCVYGHASTHIFECFLRIYVIKLKSHATFCKTSCFLVSIASSVLPFKSFSLDKCLWISSSWKRISFFSSSKSKFNLEEKKRNDEIGENRNLLDT